MARREEYLPDKGEQELYFVSDSISDSEISHFFPGTDYLHVTELAGDEEVPKEYGVDDSRVASAFETEEVKQFKLANYRNIRNAGAYLDEVLFDIDNDQDMLEPDIRNRLTEAYANINRAKRRVRDFEPESTSLIYTSETKELFIDYLETLQDKVRFAGWETGVNVEREYENRESDSINVYRALEPKKNDSSMRIGTVSGSSETKASAD